jgi:hypothetical protein
MLLSEFTRLFDLSTSDAIAFAKTMLVDELPGEFTYRLFPNQSYDDNRAPDEIVYPDDSLESLHDFIEMSRNECINFLFRDGRIPEWIDISVGAADATRTYIYLLCCGRFTNDDNRLYYNRCQRGPFGIKSPVFPRWIPLGETNPKFRLADSPSRPNSG